MRHITLTEEEKVLINQLERESLNHIIRLRCNLLKLSGKKLSMKEIERLTDVKWLRIVDFFNAWENADGLEAKTATLKIKPGRGAKSKLEPVKEVVSNLLEANNRNLNSVLAILKEEHKISVSKSTLRIFLKKERL